MPDALVAAVPSGPVLGPETTLKVTVVPTTGSPSSSTVASSWCGSPI